MKIAIYGAGSLGTVLGAYISKAGVDIDLITRNKDHVDAMNENGAHIIGTVDMTVPVHALTPDQLTEKYDLIILMTKQLDNKNVLENLKKKLNAKRKYSERIMIYDYYKYIADYLGIEYAPVEQNYIPDYSRFQKKQG